MGLAWGGQAEANNAALTAELNKVRQNPDQNHKWITVSWGGWSGMPGIR